MHSVKSSFTFELLFYKTHRENCFVATELLRDGTQTEAVEVPLLTTSERRRWKHYREHERHNKPFTYVQPRRETSDSFVHTSQKIV